MSAVSSYFSLAYLAVFLPGSVALYAVFRQRGRRLVLLAASYIFFWSASSGLAVYMALATFTIHYAGLWLSDLQRSADDALKDLPREERQPARAAYIGKQRMVVALSSGILLGILVTLKYSRFFATNINSLLGLLNLPFSLKIPGFILPIGISFYTLQALGYVFDVYRRKIQADRNLLRLALWMSFFPQIIEGPICRYSETASSLWDVRPIKFDNLVYGLERILYGVMKKLVVADRLNLFIRNVFTDWPSHDGLVIAVAAICYTIQLYMDFSGAMDMALGSAEVFGVYLPENFRRPFFSRSISEFWRRWHITLGAWFRDYLFYPISMSRLAKRITKRSRGKRIMPPLSAVLALGAVWFCNGLWHGSAWSYVFFGFYHFTLILSGMFIGNLADRMSIKRENAAWQALQITRTVILVCIGELFFRANGLRAGLGMFGRMFTSFSFRPITDGSILRLGADGHDFAIVAIVLAMVLVVGILQERGIHIREWFARRSLALRVAGCYALIMFIVVFGAYGAGYVPVDPIYAGF